MANTNAPFGLRPVRFISGAPYNGQVNFYFATGATGVIAPGDPVVAAGAANTSEINGFQAGSLPTCTVALDGSGDPITGVCVSVLPVTRDSLQYRETSTDRVILVADDPQLIFQVQEDAGGTALAGTDAGQLAVLKVGTASTVTCRSAWTIDTATAPNTTAAFQVLLMRLAPLPNNAIGAYGIWEVMINNHQLANIADAGRFTPV